MKRKKICFVVTAESAVLCFMLAQLRELQKTYDVTLLIHTDDAGFLKSHGIYIRVVPFRIERKIHLWRDLVALIDMIRFFRQEHFDLVQSLMPKAGLLAMLAGFIARVPVRSHIFTGQVWATRTGMSRVLLKTMDRLMVAVATHLLSDSPSQRDYLVAQGVVRFESIRVLDKGSMCGVDVDRFCPDRDARERIRVRYDVGEDDVVFLFVGRLNRDKGVVDLVEAFHELSRELQHVHLIVVGPEEEVGFTEHLRTLCGDYHHRIHFTGFEKKPETYMAAADIFCLPSYRESFGDVVMEAAAVGIPAIGSRVYGITDTIIEGENGMMHAAGNARELKRCMAALATDKALCLSMGKSARERALRDFSSQQVTVAWMNYYEGLLL